MSFDTTDENYTFSFTWIIENFMLCPLKFKESLLSPKFTVENLGSTAWRIMLFPRGSKDSDYVACYLQRVKDSSHLEYVNINFRFVILDPDILDEIPDSTCDNIAFEVYQYWGFNKFLTRELIEHVMGNCFNLKLTLRCDMSLCDTDISTTVINEKISLQKLSLDIASLYQSGQFHDLVLRCDGKEFKAHQAIIIARAPKLAKKWQLDLTMGQITHRDIDHFTGDILNYLLHYLYSSSFKIPANSFQHELWLVSETYDLPDLKKKLLTYPKHYTGRTRMNIEHKSLVWRLMPFYNRSADFIKVVPLERIYLNDIIMRCSCTTSYFGLQRINFSIRFSSFDANQPIFVSCNISLVDDNDTLIEDFNGHNFFETNDEWNFVLFSIISTENYFAKRVFILCCDLTLGYGEGTTFIQSSWFYTDQTLPHFHDYSLLSWDLGRLRANVLFSDVSIVAENIKFPAHRAILAVRSPVFERMFQHNMIEKQTGIVHINDMYAHTIVPLLSYIYSGRIDTSYSDILLLYTASDKYEILTLRENCAAILISKLTVENSCQALITGYLHNDSKLLTEVEKYIRLNASRVKETLDWNFLERKFSALANQILH